MSEKNPTGCVVNERGRGGHRAREAAREAVEKAKLPFKQPTVVVTN